jgi:hypothetical protein
MGASRCVGLDLCRGAVDDVDTAAVSPPPCITSTKLLIGISDSPIVLDFILVLDCPRLGISPKPELLDEAFFLLQGRQRFENCPFLITYDVEDVFVEPFLVVTLGFLSLKSFTILCEGGDAQKSEGRE